jgi:hypothetical protein
VELEEEDVDQESEGVERADATTEQRGQPGFGANIEAMKALSKFA